METVVLLQQLHALAFLYDNGGEWQKKRRMKMRAGRLANVAGVVKCVLAPWRHIRLAGGHGVSPDGA